jgi:hypothetical protein
MKTQVAVAHVAALPAQHCTRRIMNTEVSQLSDTDGIAEGTWTVRSTCNTAVQGNIPKD